MKTIPFIFNLEDRAVTYICSNTKTYISKAGVKLGSGSQDSSIPMEKLFDSDSEILDLDYVNHFFKLRKLKIKICIIKQYET